MEHLLQILFACPKCWRVAGGLLLSVSGSFLAAGLAFSRRLERLETKAGGAVSNQLDQAVASLPIPTTGLGFALAVLGLVVGFLMAYLGKWAQKF